MPSRPISCSPAIFFRSRRSRGGVLMRAGHTEAGCDLAALAGLTPAAVICEIMKDDGTMARLPDLIEFAKTHSLKLGTIADLIHYRGQHESIVERVAERPLRTSHGAFHALAYRDKPSGCAASGVGARQDRARQRGAGASASAGIGHRSAGCGHHHALLEHCVGNDRNSCHRCRCDRAAQLRRIG